MRKSYFVPLCVLLLGLAARAQKVDTKWSCSKPAQNPMLAVGDVPDHSYALAQGTCNATAGTAGEKSGAYTEFDETWKERHTGHGRFNVTMDNGDMVYYVYETMGSADPKKPASNKWRIVNGTGKYKGMKGSGSCKGTRHEDGSSEWECTGATSMGNATKS
ncbi:MAG TPA: hypothetical protein VL983_11685 [Terriglobales bacterium]|nr:hypothetical protein [Terriglobales bacterium]